jgi:hypothetical protein
MLRMTIINLLGCEWVTNNFPDSNVSGTLRVGCKQLIDDRRSLHARLFFRVGSCGRTLKASHNIAQGKRSGVAAKRHPGIGFNEPFQPCKGCTNGCGTLSGFTILPQPPTQGGAALALGYGIEPLRGWADPVSSGRKRCHRPHLFSLIGSRVFAGGTLRVGCTESMASVPLLGSICGANSSCAEMREIIRAEGPAVHPAKGEALVYRSHRMLYSAVSCGVRPNGPRVRLFQEEFRAICRKHGIEIHQRYAWD